jgi:two-component system cell cycle response regulator
LTRRELKLVVEYGSFHKQAIRIVMDASVLVIGKNNSLFDILEQLRNLAVLHIEIREDALDAESYIDERPPDLVILDANQPTHLQLCQNIKQASYLAWIYCLFLDTRFRTAAAYHPDGAIAELKTRAAVLESGGDAYLSLISPSQQEVPAELQQHQLRLLNAQIQAGLNQARSLRELIRANDLLSAIALSDPLTELNNRRALEWELPRQVKNARSRDLPLSLVILDIDYFKSVNDTYGHLVGDRVLQLLAERLRHNMRFYDTPFRYGGEEFVLLLASTGDSEASPVADRIRRLVADQAFRIEESLSLNLTISVGVASLTDEDDEKGISLLRRADERLLRAKNDGRNRVIDS